MNKQDSLATTSDNLEILLGKVPFFNGLDRVSLARLCGTLQELRLSSGVAIIDEGAEADSMYLLESGRVEVSVKRPDEERSLAQLEAPAYFGEIGLLLSRRSGSVRSPTDVVLWKIPRDGFERVVAERPAVALAVAASAVELLERRQRQMIGAPVERPGAPRRPTFVLAPRTRSTVWRIVGFALAVGVPLALWALPPPGGLTVRGWHVSLVLLGAAVGWLAEPLPDFIIALLMAAVWGVAGLAPVSLAFAGFTTSSWIVDLGALGRAVAMARSGLLFRIALLFLRTFPPTHGGQVLALLLGGLVVTPVVPLALARIAAVAPLARELAEALGYPARSRARAGVAFAALAGYGLFSSVFLSGLVMNFFVVGLLPEAQRLRFSWLFWSASAAPAGAVVLVGGALMVLRLFPAEVASRATAEVLRRQQQVLGPLSRPERILLAALGILVIGLILQPVVHIDAAWVTVGALTVATAGSALDRERFRGSIDWDVLRRVARRRRRPAQRGRGPMDRGQSRSHCQCHREPGCHGDGPQPSHGWRSAGRALDSSDASAEPGAGACRTTPRPIPLGGGHRRPDGLQHVAASQSERLLPADARCLGRDPVHRAPGPDCRRGHDRSHLAGASCEHPVLAGEFGSYTPDSGREHTDRLGEAAQLDRAEAVLRVAQSMFRFANG